MEQTRNSEASKALLGSMQIRRQSHNLRDGNAHVRVRFDEREECGEGLTKG